LILFIKALSYNAVNPARTIMRKLISYNQAGVIVHAHPADTPEFELEDLNGFVYKAEYFRFPKALSTAIVDRCIADAIPSILKTGEAAFPNYSKNEMKQRIAKKVHNAQAITLIYAPSRSDSQKKVIGFHIDNIQTMSLEGFPAKVMYLNQVAMHPYYQGKGLMQAAISRVFLHEQPDILCASSANPSMHGVARNIADKHAMVAYPLLTGEKTPMEVYVLANTIHNKLTGRAVDGRMTKILQGAKLDNRLVRTYESKTSHGDGRKDRILNEVLQLNESQHAFFIALKPQLNTYIRSTWRKR
jgi:hypothetical protein